MPLKCALQFAWTVKLPLEIFIAGRVIYRCGVRLSSATEQSGLRVRAVVHSGRDQVRLLAMGLKPRSSYVYLSKPIWHPSTASSILLRQRQAFLLLLQL